MIKTLDYDLSLLKINNKDTKENVIDGSFRVFTKPFPVPSQK